MRHLLACATVGFSAALAAVALFFYFLHLPSAGAVGLGSFGPRFWQTYAAYVIAYGGAAGVLGALVGVAWALVARGADRNDA